MSDSSKRRIFEQDGLLGETIVGIYVDGDGSDTSQYIVSPSVVLVTASGKQFLAEARENPDSFDFEVVIKRLRPLGGSAGVSEKAARVDLAFVSPSSEPA